MPAEPESRATVPLHPRRRLVGSPFGSRRSVRRGHGSDVVGSRPYRPGDPVHAIDWKTSARLSALSGGDDFLVRERYSEEAPRVAIVCDRRPSMALFPAELPWLSKPRAVAAAALLLARSAVAERSLVGYLGYAGGAPLWRAPRAASRARRGDAVDLLAADLERPCDAPPDGLARALALLAGSAGALPVGSFVFVLSDLLAPPPRRAWQTLVDRGLDVVALVVQDPVWEQSFPAVGGKLVQLVDPASGALLPVRLSRREADERRREHEARLAGIERELAALGVDAVLLGDDDPLEIHRLLLAWSDGRVALRGRLR